MHIREKRFKGHLYKYHPYPRYDCFEYISTSKLKDFYFNREYTEDKYYSGYSYKSVFSDRKYKYSVCSLIETNFCLDEYIYFRDLILDSCDGRTNYYDVWKETRIPHDKLYVMFRDIKLMGEAEVFGEFAPIRKPYSYVEIIPVDVDVRLLKKSDYFVGVHGFEYDYVIEKYPHYPFLE